MSNAKVKISVDSNSNPFINFHKSGVANERVKMIHQNDEFKIQKYTGSTLEDIMVVNEDGLVTFKKDVNFRGTNTIVNTETLSLRDQTVELGLSETNQVNSSGITKTVVTQGTTTFTTESNNLTSGISYILGGKNSSYNANVVISGYTPLQTYSLSGSGTTWTTSSSVELTPSNMSASNMAFFSNLGSSGSSNFNSTSSGSFNNSTGQLSLRLNYNTNLYNNLSNLTVNQDLVKFSSSNTSSTFFDNLLGRLTNLSKSSDNTIMYVNLQFDTNNSTYPLTSYSLPSSSSQGSFTSYSRQEVVSSTSYTSGTSGYVFTLTDSNLSNPYSANDYVYLNNCLYSGSAIFNTANKVASVSGSTITIESSENYTAANITDNGKIYMSKLSTVSNNTGLCIVGVDGSNNFVDGCVKYDSSTNLTLENNSGKIKIGSENIAQNVTIAEAGARQVNIGSASAAAITVDTGAGISLDAVSASNFTTSAGALTLNGAGGLTQVGGANSTTAITGTYDIDSTAALSLNSSGAAINIGNDTTNYNVNIGTGGTRNIILGNAGSTLTIAGTVSLGGSLATDTIAGQTVSISSSSNAVNIDGASGVNIGTNTTTAVDLNATSLAIDSTDNSNLTLTANAAATKTLTISATNADANNVADIDLDADGSLYIDGASGIFIGSTTASALDLNTTTCDIDASGALTIDSGTSISIGTNADKPIDIDASTLAIDSTDSTNLTLTANASSTKTLTIAATNSDSSNIADIDIDADGTLTLDGASGITIGATNASALDLNTTTCDIDASGALTIDAASINIGGSNPTAFTLGTATCDINASGAFTLDASEVTIGASSASALDLNTTTCDIDASGALTIDAASINIGGSNPTAFTLGTAGCDINASGAFTLDASAVTIGASSASALDLNTTTCDIDASGAVTIDGGSITIGGTTASALDLNTTTCDIDASGALTVDAASINIGGTTASAFTLGTTTLDINASSAITVDGGSITIGASSASALDLNTTTCDIDATGALTIDSATSISIGTTADKPMDIDASTLAIDSSDTTNLTMTANTGSDKTLTIAASNSNSGNYGNLAMSADGDVTLNTTTDAKKIYIGNSNNTSGIYIGSTGARTVQVGNTSATVNVYNFSSYSDLRLKENVVKIDNTLDKVLKLDGVHYNWIADEQKKTQVGFIAQRVEEIFPELINKSNDGYKTVNYLGMTAVLLEAIKEQQKQIEELKNKLN